MDFEIFAHYAGDRLSFPCLWRAKFHLSVKNIAWRTRHASFTKGLLFVDAWLRDMGPKCPGYTPQAMTRGLLSNLTMLGLRQCWDWQKELKHEEWWVNQEYSILDMT